jgi:hypothetical protein
LCSQLDSVWLLSWDKKNKYSVNRDEKIVFDSDIQDGVTIYVLYLIDGEQEKLKYKK